MASGQPVEITYSHPETQPPVYVAASLTSPPWEPHEMGIDEQKTEAGDLVFRKRFEDVKEGEYQYKFRLGPGDWWVLDETAPVVTDAAGFRNNLLVVKAPPTPAPSAPSPPQTTEQPEERPEQSVQPTSELPPAPPAPMSSEDLETHTADQATEAPSFLQEPKTKHTQTEPEKQVEEIPAAPQESVPVPFTVVEKVPDQTQPVYGDIDSSSLHEKDDKRAADPEPDAVIESPEANTQPLEQSEASADAAPAIPTLVVEKTDDEPRHGDDMGPDATDGQKEAHEKRLADAEPDAVVISDDLKEIDQRMDSLANGHPGEAAVDGEDNVPEHERSPMFRHESFAPEDEHDEEDVSELERVPTFKHEVIDSSSSDEDEPRSPHLDGPVTSGPTPLFAYERATTTTDGAHQPHGADEQEPDLNDPSLEKFPTERDEIYRHIARTESRMPEDDDVEDPTSLPSSPLQTRNSHSPIRSVGSASPLDAVAEADEVEGEEGDGELGEPALSESQQQQETADEPEATESADSAEAPAQSDGTHEAPNTENAPAAADAGLMTPPMTPKGFLLDDSKPAALTERTNESASGTTEPTEGEGLRKRKGVETEEREVSRSSSETETEVEAPKEEKVGLLAALWRAVFGSIRRLFAGVFGSGKAASTSVTVMAAAAFAAYYYGNITS